MSRMFLRQDFKDSLAIHEEAYYDENSEDYVNTERSHSMTFHMPGAVCYREIIQADSIRVSTACPWLEQQRVNGMSGQGRMQRLYQKMPEATRSGRQ